MIIFSNPKINFGLRTMVSIMLLCLVALIPSLAAGQSIAKARTQFQYSSYARYATGINIFGSPKDWVSYAAQYGYGLSDKPVSGGVIIFDPTADSQSNSYGMVGVVTYYYDDSDYWKIGVRYASPKSDTSNYYDYAYVTDQEIRVSKNVSTVHYIYRDGANKYPAYYIRPEYSDAEREITVKQLTVSKENCPITIYSDKEYLETNATQGQPVRILSKAEIGETLWVYIQVPSQNATYYLRPYSYGYPGNMKQKNIFVYSPEAQEVYYAKNYGDTILDLGYVDYSKLAGYKGKVIVTIKKGESPIESTTIQTFSLQFQKE